MKYKTKKSVSSELQKLNGNRDRDADTNNMSPHSNLENIPSLSDDPQGDYKGDNPVDTDTSRDAEWIRSMDMVISKFENGLPVNASRDVQFVRDREKKSKRSDPAKNAASDTRKQQSWKSLNLQPPGSNQSQ